MSPNSELVRSVDKKTSLQPRSHLHPPQPAQPGNIPNRHEHEYMRSGALSLFAAFDIRSGKVFGQCHPRKRQQGRITFLDQLDVEIDHNGGWNHPAHPFNWSTKSVAKVMAEIPAMAA
jgi:hypothetical protein